MSPVSSPKRIPSSGSRGETKRTVERRDFSEWGINPGDFDVSLLSMYGDRFLLIYKRGDGTYRAVWAPGRLFRGDQLLNTAREAAIETITDSLLIQGYPFNLRSRAVDGNVLAAISSLDERAALKYISMGDSSVNLSDLLDYLKISRLIGDKTLVDALIEDLKRLGELDMKAFKADISNIEKELSAGIVPARGLVSRVVGEKVNVPEEVIDPRSTGSVEAFMSAFRDGVRAHPIVVGTRLQESPDNYSELISILSDYKAIGQGFFGPLLASGKYPNLMKNPTVWKYMTHEDFIGGMKALTLLEAFDLLSLPLKEVDLSAPYIFPLDDMENVTRNVFALGTGGRVYPVVNEFMFQLAALYVTRDEHPSLRESKFHTLFRNFPLGNSALTGEIVGKVYNDRMRPPVGDTILISRYDNYRVVPITSESFGEEKSVYTLSRLQEVTKKVTIDGEEYISVGMEDDDPMYLRYTWMYPFEIVNWDDEEKFHKTAREQIIYITSVVPSTRYRLDEKNGVYYVWDEKHRFRPWLIYRGTLSDIFRSSLPNKRIAVIRGDDGKLRGYTSASLISSSLYPSFSCWYYNTRPGVDRSEMYEPIHTLDFLIRR